MTYTLPLVHKYRFIIAILLTALLSVSMVAFKLTSAIPAEAASPPQPQASLDVSTVLFKDKTMTPLVKEGAISATEKITFEKPKVTTTPAPKKEEPVVEKPAAETPKPADTPANTTPTPAATPAAAAAAAAKSSAIPAPAVAAAKSATPAAPVAAAPMTGTSPAAAQSFARSYLAGKGLGEAEFQCLVKLWHHESGWNFQASNPSSGAYGIPQSLPGSKMASIGADWQTNPQTQIIWGVSYIEGRYGSPCGAMAAWTVKGWY